MEEPETELKPTHGNLFSQEDSAPRIEGAAQCCQVALQKGTESDTLGLPCPL